MLTRLLQAVGLAKREYTVETFQVDAEQPYFWRLRHLNTNKLATSEGYVNRGDRDDVAERLASALGVKLLDLGLVVTAATKHAKKRH